MKKCHTKDLKKYPVLYRWCISGITSEISIPLPHEPEIWAMRSIRFCDGNIIGREPSGWLNVTRWWTGCCFEGWKMKWISFTCLWFSGSSCLLVSGFSLDSWTPAGFDDDISFRCYSGSTGWIARTGTYLELSGMQCTEYPQDNPPPAGYAGKMVPL